MSRRGFFATRKNLARDISIVAKYQYIDDKMCEPIVKRLYPKFSKYKGNLSWTQFLAFLMKTYNDTDDIWEAKTYPSDEEWARLLRIRIPLPQRRLQYNFEISRKFWNNIDDDDNGITDLTNSITFISYVDAMRAKIIDNNGIYQVLISSLPKLMQLITRYLNYDNFIPNMRLYEFLWLISNNYQYSNYQIGMIIVNNSDEKIFNYIAKNYKIPGYTIVEVLENSSNPKIIQYIIKHYSKAYQEYKEDLEKEIEKSVRIKITHSKQQEEKFKNIRKKLKLFESLE